MVGTPVFIQALVASFGVEDTVSMLEHTQPFVANWEQQLAEAFSQEDWEAAAQCAHKAISSVRLYGSPELEALLSQIVDRDECVKSAGFHQTVFAEFATIRQVTQAWMTCHKT